MSSHKVGDRVTEIATGLSGTILAVEVDALLGDGWLVAWDDGTQSASYACWYDLVPADTPSEPPRCDCGGWTVGTHSGWCSNPRDNARRKKGLQG